MRFRGFLAVAVMAWASPALADSLDPMIEGAKQCTRHLARVEREYGIPTHLLSAIASTESGRYHQGLNITLPWPWTINAEGKGYYFNSKQEAIAAVKRLKSQGVSSIDVGCMQVNLHHHPDAFASLEDAFTPEKNVAYAASFLRTLFEQSRSWKEAAGDYHSKTPERGTQYVGLVYDKWYTLINRLREARANVGDSTQVAANLPADDVAKPVELTPLADAAPKVVRVMPKVINDAPQRKLATNSNSGMHSIKISSVSSYGRERDNGVLVIRPQIKVVDDAAETFTVAQTTPVSATVSAPVDGSQIIRIGGAQAPAQQTAHREGPRFIFE